MNEPAAALTIDQALKQAATQLQAVAPDTAALDARLLLQHVLQCEWPDLILNKNSLLSTDETAQWHAVLAERLQHKPVAKILGHAEFYGASFKTTTDTLDPRPDSETLIDIIQRLYADHGNPIQILDLGTGTGCLLLTLLRLYPYARGTGADLSDAALQVARDNAMAQAVDNRAQFLTSNWFANLSGTYDLIVSNPPYIVHDVIDTLSTDVRAYDPMLALDGGVDGLDPYRTIVNEAHDFLNAGGWLVVEIGYDQAEAVNALFAENGFANTHVYYDLSGHPRVVSGQKITV
jgi:release factor glutamine methyltransferase